MSVRPLLVPIVTDIAERLPGLQPVVKTVPIPLIHGTLPPNKPVHSYPGYHPVNNLSYEKTFRIFFSCVFANGGIHRRNGPYITCFSLRAVV